MAELFTAVDTAHQGVTGFFSELLKGISKNAKYSCTQGAESMAELDLWLRLAFPWLPGAPLKIFRGALLVALQIMAE